MPIAQSHAQAEVIDGEIWLAGSMVGDRDGAPSKQVWIYNPDKDQWRQSVPLPAARGAGGFVQRGKYVHFFGGQNKDHKDASTHWRLKIDGGKKWQKRAPLPNPRNHVGNVTLDGKIYAIGGQHHLEQEHATADVHVYLNKRNKWKKVASLPEPMHHVGPSIIAVNGRIIVAGGQNGNKDNRDTIIAYDPKTDEWDELGELPGERKSVILGAVGKLLILTAGNTPAPSRSTFVGFLDHSLFN